MDRLLNLLNAPEKNARLQTLRELASLHKSGSLPAPVTAENVNNHIHTTYSFSPYSPSKALYTAWINGLATAGIMDHDSIAGAREFIEAGEIIGISTTVGFECRCHMRGTPFEGRRINNPDQVSVAYLAMHGIPHQNIEKVQDFLNPYREFRNARNKKMVGRINGIKELNGIALDFERDVVPLSEHGDGGAVTERHILFALSLLLTQRIGRGEKLIAFLNDGLGISVTDANRGKLNDVGNEMYPYFLLNILKGRFVERFYVEASDECPSVGEFIKLARDVGGISAYAYLGDVTDSVTGDKIAQTFEDSFLDELFGYLAGAGFNAVTYMPTRNTYGQLSRVMKLCESRGFFQISGEDINSPFQSFICAALEKPEFKHLVDSTWALIGHEKAASLNQENGMFSPVTVKKIPSLDERKKRFMKIGKN